MATIDTDAKRSSYPSWIQRFILTKELGLILLLLAVIVFVMWQTETARQSRVYFDMIQEVSPNVIAAIGVAMLMLAGEFDLSIGSMLAFTGVVTVVVFNETDNMWLGIIAGMATGPLIGGIHGYLVTVQGMNSLMTTLGSLFALRGLVFIYTNQTPILDENRFDAFQSLYHDDVILFGTKIIPVPALIALVLVIIFHVVLTQTEFGRQIYAIGGNDTAARVSGIPVGRVKFILFILGSSTAAFAGLLLASQTSNGYFDAGRGFELAVIAAVVLGGVSLAGGQGGLVGAVLGVLILGMTSKGLRLMRINTNWQLVITGTVMGIAVYMHDIRSRIERLRR